MDLQVLPFLLDDYFLDDSDAPDELGVPDVHFVGSLEVFEENFLLIHRFLVEFHAVVVFWPQTGIRGDEQVDVSPDDEHEISWEDHP